MGLSPLELGPMHDTNQVSLVKAMSKLTSFRYCRVTILYLHVPVPKIKFICVVLFINSSSFESYDKRVRFVFDVKCQIPTRTTSCHQYHHDVEHRSNFVRLRSFFMGWFIKLQCERKNIN